MSIFTDVTAAIGSAIAWLDKISDFSYWGLPFGKIVYAFLVLLVFVLLRHLFARLVLRRIRNWAREMPGSTEQIVESLHRPVRNIPLLIGLFLALHILPLEGRFEEIAQWGVSSVAVVILFWAGYNLTGVIGDTLHRFDQRVSPAIVNWVIKLAKVVVALIGVVTFLELWGIEVAPIIAGFGLFGVAVALGAQDLFRNLIAGALILAERRFHPGDWIRVDGIAEGTVEVVGFRSTRIRQFDLAPIYVPNGKLSDNAVTNFSAMTFRRIYWSIGVEYRTSIEQLRRIRDEIEAYLLSSPAFVNPPEASTFVRIDRFNDSSIDLLLYCFTRTTVWGEWLEAKEALALKIKEIVEGAGTAFAFPSQSVYVESIGGAKPELFTPPQMNQEKERT